ncbi:MAG: indole-3-glycerol phosphate synthase TrpC [Proteobacteria bacterium]|nr:indole-3-glycerol phosphate synthase TrpC [Pseudomonadota bacterium]MCP4919440.1 indole-3-glycerol phosphate synthase TrpC [Pseudomonadota bacterium]
MSFLDRIRPAKLAEVEALQGRVFDLDQPPVRSLAAALKAPGLSVIAEVKRRSPTRGDIRPGADPVEIANGYANAGAAAISVLTDEPHFGGTLADLRAVTAPVPVLRKDFILDELQLDEAREAGADAALLIVAFLTPSRLAELHAHAHAIGLEVLVETHSAEEIRIALDAGSRIVGVNNRDLKALTIDLAVCEALIPTLPDDVVKVAESGVFTRQDAARMAAAGADAILVGSSLMSKPDPAQALADLCG